MVVVGQTVPAYPLLPIVPIGSGNTVAGDHDVPESVVIEFTYTSVFVAALYVETVPSTTHDVVHDRARICGVPPLLPANSGGEDVSAHARPFHNSNGEL